MARFDAPITVLPCFSLEPNKLVSYNRVFKKDKGTVQVTPDGEIISESRPRNIRLNFNKSVKRQSHNYKISDNAYRTLKRRINWLYYLSKSKSVKTFSGKEIYNFKIGFLTLTLPSKQRTCTKELTNKVFNTFLTEIRQKTGMTNYVWRLEFQKNGNAHYHLVTDTFLDYHSTLNTWNRILDYHGYIEPYTCKHKNLSLQQYVKKYSGNGKTPFATLAKRYAVGKKNNWSQPNTIDLKSVITKKSIASYLAKYFAKDSKNNSICNELDTPENSSNLRLWFCSRGLSKLKSVSDFCEAVEYDIFALVSGCKRLRKVFGRYASVWYYDLHKFGHWSRTVIEKILKDYAKKQGYIPQ